MKTPLESAAKIETEVRCIMKSFIALELKKLKQPIYCRMKPKNY